jgi:hypothetical protein
MDKQITEITAPDEALAKKDYLKPTLREFGTVHMTTLGSSGGMIDAANGMGTQMDMRPMLNQ